MNNKRDCCYCAHRVALTASYILRVYTENNSVARFVKFSNTKQKRTKRRSGRSCRLCMCLVLAHSRLCGWKVDAHEIEVESDATKSSLSSLMLYRYFCVAIACLWWTCTHNVNLLSCHYWTRSSISPKRSEKYSRKEYLLLERRRDNRKNDFGTRCTLFRRGIDVCASFNEKNKKSEGKAMRIRKITEFCNSFRFEDCKMAKRCAIDNAFASRSSPQASRVTFSSIAIGDFLKSSHSFSSVRSLIRSFTRQCTKGHVEW